MAKEPRVSWSGSRAAQAEYEASLKEAKRRQSERAVKAAPSKLKRRRRKRRHVSYFAYIKSAAWERKRQEAFAHYGEKCGRCSATKRLAVHHKSYKRLGREKMEDLEILCLDCHGVEHEDAGHFNSQTREFFKVVE